MISPEEAEELTCLAVLGLLEPPEPAGLETPPDASERLPTLRRELNEAVCQLAWLAPAYDPPARLRARVLAAALPAHDPPL